MAQTCVPVWPRQGTVVGCPYCQMLPEGTRSPSSGEVKSSTAPTVHTGPLG